MFIGQSSVCRLQAHTYSPLARLTQLRRFPVFVQDAESHCSISEEKNDEILPHPNMQSSFQRLKDVDQKTIRDLNFIHSVSHYYTVL